MPLHRFLQTLSSGSAATRWLGVSADAMRLNAAIVQRRADGRPRVMACAAFDGAQALQALATWRRQRGSRGMRANLLLNASDYQILPIEAPEVAATERAAAARWRVKDMIDYPADEACVDCLLVPAAEGSVRTRQALAVVTRRDTIVAWLARSRQAQVDLHSIDIPELALRNLAALLPGDRTISLLHVGLARTTLLMVWKGELCTSRRFDLNANQLMTASPEAREQLLERLGLEVQRTADAFERQFQAAALGDLWVTQESPSLALAVDLTRFVALPVQPFQFADWLDLDTTSPLFDPERGIDFATAIGAALRQEAAL